jgi:UDP-glucose 4-epimerase
MSSKNLKVLVVGGSGFIGSHVADELDSEGFDVTIYDANKSDWLKPTQKFIQGSMLEKEKLLAATKGFDIVYHFAAVADIGEASERRLEAIEVNILGSVYLIEACLQNKVKTFVFASSVYVYSNKGSFYRVTKQAVENLLEEYAQTEGLDYRILRYGSLYGPRAQTWNGLRRYIENMVHEGQVTLRSEGQAKREYIHVADAARLSVDALNPKYKSQHLLLTGSQSITSQELVTMVGEMLDKEIKVSYKDKQGDSHYIITPYKYVPKHGIKMTSANYVDFGQGVLEIIEEVSHQKR